MRFVRTAGQSSLDLYSQWLGAELEATIIDTNIYQSSSELFNEALLSRKSLAGAMGDIAFARTLRKDNHPVHFPNHHLARYGWFLKTPYIVTIHDLIRYFDVHGGGIYIHKPNHRDRLMLSLDYTAIRRATALIAISEATKRDLVRYLKVSPERIHVVYSGVDHSVFRPTDDRIVDGRYILYVGSEQRRKNLVSLINALAILRSEPRFRDVILVKVGPAGGRKLPFREYTMKAVRDAGLSGAVHFTEFVDQADLPKFYAGAQCTVLPSLIEGFGFPIVEAMACGSPVVTSNRSALPEIVGSAGISVDPTPASLAGVLADVLSDSELRAKMTRTGITRASEFTWRRTAEQTQAVYESLLNSGRLTNGRSRGTA